MKRVFFKPTKFDFLSQLLANFLLISILPVLICCIVAYCICYNVILDNSINISNEIMDFASRDINSIQKVAKNISKSMITNSELQIIMRYNNLSSTGNLVTPFHINSSLKLMKSVSLSEILGIYCFNDNGTYYQSNTSFDKNDSWGKDDSFLQKQWYNLAHESSDGIWFEPSSSFVLEKYNEDVIKFATPFIDYQSNKPIGVILIEISPSIFFDNLKQSDSLASNTYYISNEYGEIIFSSDSSHTISGLNKKTISSLNNYSYLYSSTLLNNWNIIATVSQNEVAVNAMFYLALLLIILMILIIGMSIIISFKRATEISLPIRILSQKMSNTTPTDLAPQLTVPDSNDDIMTLYKSFNLLLKNEQLYINKIKDDQKKLQIANFIALQSQITPHFLYNTLDTIAWNIRLDRKDRAISGVMGLTNFFRLSLSKGEDIISLEQEFEHIETYLQIQMLRYDDMFTYEVNLDPILSQYAIPKLSIQPLVENAIYHGIKNKGDFGKIIIKSEMYTDYYTITIFDDGIGIPPQKVDSINNDFKSPIIKPNINTSGYGSHNVNSRIKIYFGYLYGLSIESKEDEYTKITMKLPYIYKSNIEDEWTTPFFTHVNES